MTCSYCIAQGQRLNSTNNTLAPAAVKEVEGHDRGQVVVAVEEGEGIDRHRANSATLAWQGSAGVVQGVVQAVEDGGGASQKLAIARSREGACNRGRRNSPGRRQVQA